MFPYKRVLYSTRDSDMFRWVVKSICQPLFITENNGKKCGHNFTMNFSFTCSSSKRDHYDNEDQCEEWFEELRRETIRRNISISRSRIVFE